MSEPTSDRTSERDDAQELYELARGFRIHLQRYRRGGTFAVSARPSARPAGPVADEAEPEGTGDGPDLEPHARPGPGFFTAALAQALGDSGDPPGPSPAPSPGPAGSPARSSALAQVRAELGDCQRCKLWRTRQNIVFGDGAPDAALMFIGEAPGQQEDLRGLPFVGPAGHLLDRMIAAMGWSRDTVYIANVLKCRPPGNRDPEPDEVATCKPFLKKQIAAVEPRVIVTLGRPAAHLVLETTAPIHALRGRFHTCDGVQVMPTFHPAYLLRNPEHKRKTWSDLKQVIACLENLGIASPFPPKK